MDNTKTREEQPRGTRASLPPCAPVRGDGVPERIGHEPNDPEAWVCRCGNTPAMLGFFPCDRAGNPVEPTAADWPEPLYRCDDCGRIIDGRTLIVVGRDRDNGKRR
jgi:hypothetical protein